MASALNNFGGNGRPCLVRWSDHPGQTDQEESGLIIGEGLHSVTVRIVKPLCEATRVSVRADSSPENGIVKSCLPEGSQYLVLIELDYEEMLRVGPEHIDPGVFAMESFLSEEQEQKILDSLGDFSEEETSAFEQGPDSNGDLGSLKDPSTSAQSMSSGLMALAADATLPIQ